MYWGEKPILLFTKTTPIELSGNELLNICCRYCRNFLEIDVSMKFFKAENGMIFLTPTI